MIELPRSREALARARELIPGGVNSPVRAYTAVGGQPPVIERGAGPLLFDIDGHRYIDYVGSWGPLILGHAHPEVVRAIERAARRGTSFGAPCELETALAAEVVAAVPSIERVRFVNSGTEATMSAIRLARGVTGRDVVLKFAGCYHGHGDCLLADAGSGVATLGIPACAGVPAAVASLTWTAPFNDLPACAALLRGSPDRVAAVIVEPIAGNMGLVPPEPGFLEGLRALTREVGALLIFDEVMTGFRVHRGGAQALYGVEPDLTCLGKIIGGGLPVGAYGGPAELMHHVAPEGPVYQAGTLSGNPLAMAAGLATVQALDDALYEQLERRSARLAEGLSQAAARAGVPLQQTRVGSMQCLFFAEEPVRNFAQTRRCDSKRFARWFHGMLEAGIYLACSQYETLFVSAAHGDDQIERTIEAAERVLAGL